MASLSGYDTTGVKEDAFEPIPAGDYRALIADSQLKETSKGGKMIALKIQILDPKYMNRIIFDNLNIEHSKPDVTQIGLRGLKQIETALNVQRFPTTESMCNKVLVVAVRIGVDNRDGSPQNKIGKYKAALPTSTPPAAKPPAEKNMVEQAFEEEPVAAKTATKKNPYT